MNFHILTLFPDMVKNALSESITGRAEEQGIIQINTVNIRDFSGDRHNRVDDYTYGGGAGMLMQPQPIYDAWESVCAGRAEKPRTVYLTPQGRKFTQRMAEELAKEEELILLCGHYEGIDERVLEEIVTDCVSIGDYVLTGGELAAMVVVDAVARLVPGVLGNDASAEAESFHCNLLEYPQYTRPESWHGKPVPDILLSGNQRLIDQWRIEQAKERTRERRPDLYAQYERLQDCKQKMEKKKLLHIDMMQLIDRGNAELLYAGEEEILLRDKETGLCFHTLLSESTEGYDAGFLDEIAPEDKSRFHSFIFHRKEAADVICEKLGMSITCACHQGTWTMKEKVPVAGLYRPDGRPMEQGKNIGLVIRCLDVSYEEVVREHYHMLNDPTYITDRLEKGKMYGAFLPAEELLTPEGSLREDAKWTGDIKAEPSRLTGYIGYHEEGSIGMLEVFPEFKRRGIGMALETFMLNQTLERGFIPYGQIIEGNDVSIALQAKRGICVSKELLYWAKKEED